MVWFENLEIYFLNSIFSFIIFLINKYQTESIF